MALLNFLRPRCPACSQRGLVAVQWIRATVLVDGRRAPASWTYYRCPACGGHYRRALGGAVCKADDEDWRRDVGEA